MKKLFSKFIAVLIVFSMILSHGLFNLTSALADGNSKYSFNAKSEGVTFSKQTYLQTCEGLAALPNTFEAVISIPSEVGTNRAGVIFSNYHHANDAAISLELYTGGYPRLYYKADGTTTIDIVFNQVCVTDGSLEGYFHIAVTHDDMSKTAKCYINGELKQTLSYAKTYADVGVSLSTLPFGSSEGKNGEFRVGNDFRHDNSQFFKGSIKSVAVYSGVKTSFEPESIYLSSDLLVAYDLTDISSLGKDLSSYGNDAIFRGSPSFGLDEYYVVDKKLEAAPKTFEAWVKLPSTLPVGEHISESKNNVTARGGVIFGNYKSSNEASLSFEVTNLGEPKLFYINETTTKMTQTVATTIVFSDPESNLLNDEWTHLAITLDTETGIAKCYINGVLTETESKGYKEYHKNFNLSRFLIGNDYRAIHNFKGAIKGVTLYSDVRTDSQILSDFNGVNLSDEVLIASIKASNKGTFFTDVSGNGYGAYYSTVWLKNKAPITDYAYSIAVVGDTQIANMYDVRNNGTVMKDLYKWIADNAQSKKIVQVLGLGDITETSSNPTVENEMQKEWENAKNSITQLDGKVGYSLIRGNHDTINEFTSTFGSYENYTSQFSGFYQDNILNSYKLFEAEGVKYMLITLDYGASDGALAWAGELCEQYSDRRVIVTTHAYLYRDGTTLASGDVCEPSASTDRESWYNQVTRDYNNGDDIWNALIKKHENIFMVLSGHDPSIEVVCSQVKGENGNTVTQMLVDPQGIDYKEPLQGEVEGPFGLVTLLYFTADGKQIDVETYSTRYGEYHMSTNQFTVKTPCLNHVFDQELAIAEFLKAPANCMHGNIYYLSCECGECGTETFEVGDITEHVFDQRVTSDEYLVTPAYCQSRAVYKYSCICGLKGEEEFKTGNIGGHVYDQEVIKDEYLVHGATCTEPAHYKLSCKCGLNGEEEFCYGEALGHSFTLTETVSASVDNQTDGYELWACTRDASHTEKRNVIEWESLVSDGGCSSSISEESIVLYALTFILLGVQIIKRAKINAKKDI